jgi:hypothetical protein
MMTMTKSRIATALVLGVTLTPAVASARPAPNRDIGAPAATDVAFASPTSTPGHDFDWGDAGIGAAGALVLVGFGAGAVTFGRSRDRQLSAARH